MSNTSDLSKKDIKSIVIPDLYPVVKATPCGDFWRLWEDFYFYINDTEYVIPKNFLTDFASIPDLVKTALFTDKEKYSAASVIHDYVCRKKIFTRDVCDEIFYRANLMGGISKFKSYEMWIGVRSGGWYFYYGYGKSDDRIHEECDDYLICVNPNDPKLAINRKKT